LEIDKATDTDFWRKAVNKEMAKVKIAWKTNNGLTPQQAREGKAPEMIGFQEIGCHIIFDVKMDFTRKARFAAGGHHTTTTPSSMMYSSVVSRDSIRLAFLIAALNDLDVICTAIWRMRTSMPHAEKRFLGSSKVSLYYRLKSAGAAFRSSLAQIVLYRT
jgi:hypothetical protein